MTASTTPSVTPSTIAATVSHKVVHTPLRTGSVNAFCSWKSHCQFGLVTTLLTTIATSTAMIATSTQRPGCRTGMALMASGGVLEP